MFWNKNENFNSITINGKTINCTGNNVIIKNGEVIIDGKTIQTNISNNAKITINGSVKDIKCTGSVEVYGSAGSIDCGGSCNVNGDVDGNINAGGSVRCGNVSGDVDAGSSIRCSR